MAIDYQKTARELVKELGGNENISNVTHCATRLRFILKDESIVDSAKVSKIQGVITTIQAGGQYQVVIGNHVKDAFEYVMQLVTIDEKQTGGSEAESWCIQQTGRCDFCNFCIISVYTGSMWYPAGNFRNFCGIECN